MEQQFSRTELLIGKEGLELLGKAKIIVFGIGGVGSFVAEALARSGVGFLTLVDSDVIALSNVNRQVHALISTVGQDKVHVMKERIADINPYCQVVPVKKFVTPENVEDFFTGVYDYAVDAIDSLPGKIALLRFCKEKGISVISAMGAGNKLNPGKFKIADISQTSVCPLARKVRHELRKYGIQSGVKVVFSEEEPVRIRKILDGNAGENYPQSRRAPGSISFVPSVAGLLMAGEIINDLIKRKNILKKWEQ